MSRPIMVRLLRIAGAVLGIWVAIRYLLPIGLPFLLGGLLALLAEPAVRFGERKLRLRRWVSSGIGVSLTLVLLIGVISLLAGLLFRQLGALAEALPDVQQMADQGIRLLREQLLSWADRMPKFLGQLLRATAQGMSAGAGQVMGRMTEKLPGAVASVLSWLSSGILGLGTGILAAFLISARLPKLRQGLSRRIPQSWKAAFDRIRKALSGWLKAQAVLLVLTYGLVTAGLWLLEIPFGPVWAIFIAVVDAVPMLGTGTILIPWALVLFLQDTPWTAAGMLVLYGITMVTRTVLEPRLVGRQVGLDPLVILFAMYAGLRLLGFWGLVLAPIFAAAAKAALSAQ